MRAGGVASLARRTRAMFAAAFRVAACAAPASACELHAGDGKGSTGGLATPLRLIPSMWAARSCLARRSASSASTSGVEEGALVCWAGLAVGSGLRAPCGCALRSYERRTRRRAPFGLAPPSVRVPFGLDPPSVRALPSPEE